MPALAERLRSVTYKLLLKGMVECPSFLTIILGRAGGVIAKFFKVDQDLKQRAHLVL